MFYIVKNWNLLSLCTELVLSGVPTKKWADMHCRSVLLWPFCKIFFLGGPASSFAWLCRCSESCWLGLVDQPCSIGCGVGSTRLSTTQSGRTIFSSVILCKQWACVTYGLVFQTRLCYAKPKKNHLAFLVVETANQARCESSKWHITAWRLRRSGPNWASKLRTHYSGSKYAKTYSMHRVDGRSRIRRTFILNQCGRLEWGGLELHEISLSDEGRPRSRRRFPFVAQQPSIARWNVVQACGPRRKITWRNNCNNLRGPATLNQCDRDSGCQGLYVQSWLSRGRSRWRRAFTFIRFT